MMWSPRQEAVCARLAELNKFDLELWAYATELVSRRYQLAAGFYSQLEGGEEGGEEEEGGSRRGRCREESGGRLPPRLEKHLGVFRPPGHKGPW